MENKLLVCITIQENSKRLISEGHLIAESINAPLHILHIRKGETVFDNPDSSNLLEELFAYGGELGGEVHFVCGDNIPETIENFIDTNHITHLLLGEAPEALTQETPISNELKQKLSHIEVHILPREN